MPLIIATKPAPEPSLNSAPRCISSDSISFQWMLLLRWSLNIAESTFWCFLLTVLFQFVFCINHCIKLLIFNIVFKSELNPYRRKPLLFQLKTALLFSPFISANSIICILAGLNSLSNSSLFIMHLIKHTDFI